MLQINKCDLVPATYIDELKQEINHHNAPLFEAVAHKGFGVYDTIKELTKQILISMSSSSPSDLEKYKALEKYSRQDLAKIAKTDVDDDKRLVAITHLTKARDEISKITLIELLNDKSFRVKLKSLSALEKINSYQAIHAIVELLKATDDTIRSVAVSTLARFKDEAALNSLIAIFSSKTEPFYLRSQIIETLTAMGDEKVITPLIKALEDPSPQIRAKTVEALGRLKATKAVEAIIKKLEDTDLYVRAESAEALGRIGDKKAVAPLIKLLKEEGEPLDKAKTALTELIGEKKMLEILQKANPTQLSW